ncbi:MAG: membrane-bound lytic murein transglycosylase MltF [Gammaproteobacteria bacterium]
MLLRLACCALLLLAGCDTQILQPKSQLEKVQKRGVLQVTTFAGATTSVWENNALTGFEYELAKAFAVYLGVKLDLTLPDKYSEITQYVIDGKSDIALGLIKTQSSDQLFNFGPEYHSTSLQLIYRKHQPSPLDYAQLEHPIDIIPDTAIIDYFNNVQQDYPELTLVVHEGLTPSQLIEMLWDDVITYTVTDSNTLAMMQRYYPDLRVAKSLIVNQPLAWLFPAGKDLSLVHKAENFFNQIRNNGFLDEITHRYYGHAAEFDYVDNKRFRRHINQRLVKYYDYFVEAGQQTEIDWQLLAAIGYQESHWNPKAKSPTGVRGIMMLTQTTMKHLGIKESRLNPQASIKGGALYFKQMLKRIPERITEPDRSWFALAAYNIGFGHLNDARVLAEKDNANPDKWVQVKNYLPLLEQKKWYQQTRYGRARGHEAIQFVEHIRNYYDIMRWVSVQQPIVASKDTLLKVD